MADFDRYDNEGSNSGFMMGLLTGTVLGAGLGMLLAPRAGSELRGTIGEQARTLGNRASEQYRRAAESAQHQPFAPINDGRSEDFRDRGATTADFAQDCRLKTRDPVERRSIDLHDGFVIDTEDLCHPALADDLHRPSVLARPTARRTQRRFVGTRR